MESTISNECKDCKKDDFLGKCYACRQKYYSTLTSDDGKKLLEDWMKNYFKPARSFLESNFEKYGRYVLYIEFESFEELQTHDLEWTLLPYYSLKDVPKIKEDKEFREELEQWDVTFVTRVNYGDNLKYGKSMSVNLK